MRLVTADRPGRVHCLHPGAGHHGAGHHGAGYHGSGYYRSGYYGQLTRTDRSADDAHRRAGGYGDAGGCSFTFTYRLCRGGRR
jgi:hypothetical protein